MAQSIRKLYSVDPIGHTATLVESGYRPHRKIWRARMRGLTMIGLALVSLKVVAIMTLGANVFAAKVAVYAHTGSVADRAIAWLLQPDAVTLAVARALQGLGL